MQSSTIRRNGMDNSTTLIEDGDPNPIFSDCPCSHTKTQTWWALELGDCYTVFEISVMNRQNLGKV